MFRISAGHQYFIGLLTNVVIVFFLYNYNKTYYNLQLPEGNFSENLWKGSDVMDYVGSARSFIKSGSFLMQNDPFRYEWVEGSLAAPDMHRTIGYPFFLAAMIKIFGDKWLAATMLIQAAVAASMYPLLAKMSDLLFPDDNSLGSRVFLFSLLSGAYYASVFAIGPDLPFTVFFTAGLYSGMLAIATQKWTYIVLQLLFIGCAAEIRPTLLLFPVVNIFIMYSVSIKYKTNKGGVVGPMIIISSVALGVLCNIPSARNFYNYGVFKPTDVFDNNFYDDLGRVILLTHDKRRLDEINSKLEKANDGWERARLRREYGLAVAKEFPMEATKVILYNVANIMLSGYTILLGETLGYYIRDLHPEGHTSLKRSNVLMVIQVFEGLLSIGIYYFFIIFVIRILSERKYVYFLTVGLVIGMFLLPSFLAGPGASRFRMPVEGLIVVASLHELNRVLGLRKGRALAETAR